MFSFGVGLTLLGDACTEDEWQHFETLNKINVILTLY
jgi:hypothetical protein